MQRASTDGELTEGQLVNLAQRGDEAAFAALYDDLAPRVLGFLIHQVGDADLAEELMQGTFVKVIEALPRFETRRGVPFRAWVIRIARNAVIDDYRASHPTVGLDAVADRVSAEPGPEQAVETIAQREELVEALEQLPRDEHDVLVYRFFVGLAPAEVAPLMDRSDGAVRVLQHRALRRLRALLSADDMRPVPAGART